MLNIGLAQEKSGGTNFEEFKDLESLISKKRWNEAKYLMESKYQNVDVFPTFMKMRKQIKHEDMKKFEEVVGMANISSPSVRK